MKKADLIAQITELKASNVDLTTQLEHIRTNWRPVPMSHEWWPRDPRCTFCDDPRDAPRPPTNRRANRRNLTPDLRRRIM